MDAEHMPILLKLIEAGSAQQVLSFSSGFPSLFYEAWSREL